jgi:hypothetical protein
VRKEENVRIRLIALAFVVGASTLSSAAAQPAGFYGADEREIFQIDPKTGATTLVGRLAPETRIMSDIAVTPDGTIYAITIDSLLRLDPSTGVTVRVGSLDIAGRANALASDRLGRLFGATEEGTFFEVNPGTGQARTIGFFGSSILSEGDLAFAPDGTLFGTSSTNRLLRIDVATGVATVVGDAIYRQLEGLAFDPEGRLYASSFGATLISIDPSTAEALPVAVFDNGRHLDGLASTPVPHVRSATSGLSLTLAWEPIGSALSYVLEAGSSAGLKDLYNSDIGSSTTLTASAPAGTYFVRIRVRTARGIGPASNEVQVTLGDPSCTSPPPPTGFTASVARNTLTLQWNAQAGVSSYQLEAGTGPGLSNVYVGNVGPQTTLEFNIAAIPRMLYYIRLKALASCGIASIPVELVLDRR